MLWPHTKTLDVYNKETSKIKNRKLFISAQDNFFTICQYLYDLPIPPSLKKPKMNC